MNNYGIEFDNKYKDYYLNELEKIKKQYQNITSENRRTGRSLINICFFIWSYAGRENNKVLDLLIKSSILLSSQDDFCDNSNISDERKKFFYNACNDIILGKSVRLNGEDDQFTDLINLWKEIHKKVKRSRKYLYEYWQKKSSELNLAMEKENHILRKKEIDFNSYMQVTTDSIGIMFVWSTYFTQKNISAKD